MESSDVHTNTSDVGDDSRGSFKSWKRGENLTPWERDIVESGEVRRKANVAQLCACLPAQAYAFCSLLTCDFYTGRLPQSLL